MSAVPVNMCILSSNSKYHCREYFRFRYFVSENEKSNHSTSKIENNEEDNDIENVESSTFWSKFYELQVNRIVIVIVYFLETCFE